MKSLLIYWIIAAFDFVVVVFGAAQFDVVAAVAEAYDDVAMDAVDIVVGNKECWEEECC